MTRPGTIPIPVALLHLTATNARLIAHMANPTHDHDTLETISKTLNVKFQTVHRALTLLIKTGHITDHPDGYHINPTHYTDPDRLAHVPAHHIPHLTHGRDIMTLAAAHYLTQQRRPATLTALANLVRCSTRTVQNALDTLATHQMIIIEHGNGRGLKTHIHIPADAD